MPELVGHSAEAPGFWIMFQSSTAGPRGGPGRMENIWKSPHLQCPLNTHNNRTNHDCKTQSSYMCSAFTETEVFNLFIDTFENNIILVQFAQYCQIRSKLV